MLALVVARELQAALLPPPAHGAPLHAQLDGGGGRDPEADRRAAPASLALAAVARLGDRRPRDKPARRDPEAREGDLARSGRRWRLGEVGPDEADHVPVARAH